MPKVKLTSHIYDDLPRNIRTLAAVRGYRSDAAIAEKLGVTRATMSYRLRNPASIDGEMIDKLCRIFRIKPSQLWEPVVVGENCKPLEVRA